MSFWLEDWTRFLPFGLPLLAIAIALFQVYLARRRSSLPFTDDPDQ